MTDIRPYLKAGAISSNPGSKKLIIDINYETAFVLYAGEVRRYGIRQDEYICDEVYHEIVEEVLVKRAKLRAMNILQRSDQSEKMLRDKLAAGMYPQEVIDNTIEYVKKYGYIDDSRYAYNYVNAKSRVKSRKVIMAELKNRGISEEMISQLYCDRSPDEEDLLIQKLLQKKKYNRESASYEEKMKIKAYLMRKGFSMDRISAMMD